MSNTVTLVSSQSETDLWLSIGNKNILDFKII